LRVRGGWMHLPGSVMCRNQVQSASCAASPPVPLCARGAMSKGARAHSPLAAAQPVQPQPALPGEQRAGREASAGEHAALARAELELPRVACAPEQRGAAVAVPGRSMEGVNEGERTAGGATLHNPTPPQTTPHHTTPTHTDPELTPPCGLGIHLPLQPHRTQNQQNPPHRTQNTEH